MTNNIATYIGRIFACAIIVVACFLLMPRNSTGKVYLEKIEDGIARIENFPYQVLGGGVMEVSINGQRADSLLIKTSLAPRNAVEILFASQDVTNTKSSRELMGIIGNDQWAVYMDLFPDRLYDDGQGGILGGAFSDPENPSLVVTAYKDNTSQQTVVNLLTFTGRADLRKAFMSKDKFQLDFHEGDKTLGKFNFSQVSGQSTDSVVANILSAGLEEGLSLEYKSQSDQVLVLMLTGKNKTRDVFITGIGSETLGVLIQDRNSRGVK